MVSGAGRGLGRDYKFKEDGATPGAIGEHFRRISGTEPFRVPTALGDSMAFLPARFDAGGTGPLTLDLCGSALEA